MMSVLSKWKIAIYLAAIFFAGGVSGWMIGAKAAKQKIFSPPDPREISSHMRDRLHSKLDLTEDQSKKVDALIEKNSKEMQAIHGDCMKKIFQGMTSFNAQLKALLTPEQQAKFEDMERERREAFRNHHFGPGGPGGRHGPPKRNGTNGPPPPDGAFRPSRGSASTNALDQL